MSLAGTMVEASPSCPLCLPCALRQGRSVDRSAGPATTLDGADFTGFLRSRLKSVPPSTAVRFRAISIKSLRAWRITLGWRSRLSRRRTEEPVLRRTMIVLAAVAALTAGLSHNALALATAHTGWDGLGDGGGQPLIARAGRPSCEFVRRLHSPADSMFQHCLRSIFVEEPLNFFRGRRFDQRQR
jgi:hypothetical protein